MDEMIKEAINRMKKMKFGKNVIEKYINGIILQSDNVNRVIKEIEDEEILNRIKELKAKGYVPFHVITSKISIMNDVLNMKDILFVSKYKEEWEFERPTDDGWIYSASSSEATFGDYECGAIRIRYISKIGAIRIR